MPRTKKARARRTAAGKYVRVHDIERALRATGGIVTQTAAMIGCSRDLVEKRMKESSHLRRVSAEVAETWLDEAENALRSSMLDREGWAVQFVLRCKGRQRGWTTTERVEVTGANGGPVDVRVDVDGLVDWLTERAMEAIEAEEVPALPGPANREDEPV